VRDGRRPCGTLLGDLANGMAGPYRFRHRRGVEMPVSLVRPMAMRHDPQKRFLLLSVLTSNQERKRGKS
jgi:hypothetical protein